MTTVDAPNIAEHIREVTDAEVEAYRRDGWASLPGLVSAELARDLLSHLKRIVGVDYDELEPDHPEAQSTMERIKAAGPRLFHMSRLQDEHVWDFVTSRSLGEAAARLTGNRPLRIFTDGVICKMPAWMENMGGLMSGATPWHQDFPPVPWDRAGGVQFWLALCEITPEMGSMQHLSGSQHEPPLGCVQYTKGEQKAEELYPELWERYELSHPHHLQPGDVLAHDPMTMHFAEANTTNRFRWVYTSYRVPANTLYNGLANPRFEEFGFEPWKPFDHPRFPIVVD